MAPILVENMRGQTPLPMGSEHTYVIITPVKNEEPFIETTIRAILQQTVLPLRWVIVDDGSEDATAAIARRYQEKYNWITLLSIAPGADRQPGAGVIRAFNRGLDLIRQTNADFIVKLDGDLNLPPNYFERLIENFDADQQLGIASGVYLENRGGRWTPTQMPDYHASGASKMIRRKCFDDIQGFVPDRGWDTLDEIRAARHGWKTTHFRDLQFHHLKREGTGIGFVRTNMMHGEIYYSTGGGLIFFLGKVLHRIAFGQPIIIGGLALALGYCKARLSGKSRLTTPPEAEIYRAMLRRRIMPNRKMS